MLQVYIRSLHFFSPSLPERIKHLHLKCLSDNFMLPKVMRGAMCMWCQFWDAEDFFVLFCVYAANMHFKLYLMYFTGDGNWLN